MKVISESYYPEMFKGIYQRPAEARKLLQPLIDTPGGVSQVAVGVSASLPPQ